MEAGEAMLDIIGKDLGGFRCGEKAEVQRQLRNAGLAEKVTQNEVTALVLSLVLAAA